MTTLINTVAQDLNPGARVELFRFDATSVGGSIFYFCQGAKESQPVKFGGVQYTPIDILFSDMSTSGVGSLPTPRLQISNTNGLPQNLINTYGDLLGCELRRVRTFKRFLDGEPGADPTQWWGPDTFRIERKVSENPIFIEWELSASIDQEGTMLPRRQVIRDTCGWRYRSWNGSAFEYNRVECPYTGSNYFDRSGNPTTADKDACGRRVTDCSKRFPSKILPFGGFPGVGRVRA